MENDVPAPLDIAAYLQETAHLCKATQSHRRAGCLGYADALYAGAASRGQGVCLEKVILPEEHGILIRDASNFVGLNEQFFRIAAQTPEENDRLVAAIATFMSLDV